LAEDNLVNQKVALLMLKKLGYKADAVANGLEVLQALEHQQYDLIFMDVQMPELDGLEAARKIRERWHDRLKIIAITAYALEGDMDKCLDAGMDDYISKPIQLDELRNKLLKWGMNTKMPNDYQ
jgi:CheY-like chemotaxis protein